MRAESAAPIRVLVCSTSPIKVGAVRDAAARLGLAIEVEATQASPSIPTPPQPFGRDATRDAAVRRLQCCALGLASSAIATEGADSGGAPRIAIAIENGIRHLGEPGQVHEFVDWAIVIVDEVSQHGASVGDLIEQDSQMVCVPSELVAMARDVGWQTTCGEFEAARTYGVAPDDPHVVWSGGLTNRRSLIADAVADALGTWRRRRSRRVQAQQAQLLDRGPRASPASPIAPTATDPDAIGAVAQRPARSDPPERVAAPPSASVCIGGVERDLPIRQVAPGLRLGILLLATDPELTEAAGRALAARIPAGIEVLVMPDGKAQALLHVVQRESGLPAVLLRKEAKSYLLPPVIEASCRSATTDRTHSFFLGADEAYRLRGARVAIVDDVVSTGGTLDAVRALIRQCAGDPAAVLAVATEGAPRPDVIALCHLEVH